MNLAALTVIPAIMTAAYSFVQGQMQSLIQDPAYFDVSEEDFCNALFSIMITGQIVSTALSPVYGYAYDIVGRFWLIIGSLFSLSFIVIFLPLTAPHLGLLIFVKTLMSISNRALLIKPLLIDYLKDGSRGFGLSLQAIGFGCGELFLMFIYLYVQHLEMTLKYLIAGFLLAIASISVIYMVREPKQKSYSLPADAEQN